MRDRLKGALLLLGVALLAPAAPAAAQTAPGVDAEVRAVIDRLFDAMRASDTTAMRSTFHPAARLMTTSARDGSAALSEESIDAFLASVGRAPAGMLDERLHDVEIRVDGPLASAWTPYRFHAGERFSHCGVNVFQLFRGAEGWRIIQITDTRRRDGC
jgi:hypothetical protein